MWSKRKRTNRRLKRGSVLEVKLRSSKLRAARIRFVATGLGTLFAIVLGGYALWSGCQYALNRLVYNNKAFDIQNIDLQTDGVILPDQLRRWAGVKPGDNLFALDLAAVRRRLELIPMVQSVSLDRVPPRTLRIRVVERSPIARILTARLASSGELELCPFLLDADGYVMLPLNPRERSPSPIQSDDLLPILAGVNPNEVQPGRRIDLRPVQSALDLVVAFDRSPMAGLVELRRIDISSPGVLKARTDQNSEITFGLTGLDQQLRRWREIFDVGRKLGRVISTLDLAVTDSIPCCWFEPSEIPPSTSETPATFHTRKKHV